MALHAALAAAMPYTGPSARGAQSQSQPQPQPGDILVVIHDFDARSADELTLRRSERVELIELDDGFSDGWYLGKHLTRGGTGLFPGVYTQKAPPQLARSAQHSRSNSTMHQAATNTHQPSRSSTSTQLPSLPQYSPNNYQSDEAIDPQYISNASLPAPHHNIYVQRTIGEALGEHEQRQDSPVMNETLNVIDEHITDLSTPRQSLANRRNGDDSESEYSSHLDRHSFLAGPETDDEDNALFDEITVRSWNPLQTAQHLEDIGVDARHCDIFREQEISGDVLLDMDQNFIYMKEFDFGVMGRRLKTWHKIRDFQRQVNMYASDSRRPSDLNSSLEDVARPAQPHSTLSRSGLSFRQPQHTPPITEEDDMPHPLQPMQNTKRTSWAGATPPPAWRATLAPESPALPSTSATNHSRRHSLIDFGAQPDLEFASISTPSHHKQSSFDRSWSMAGSTQATTPASYTSTKPTARADYDKATPSPTPAPMEFDRGYFSGNDMEDRKTRNRLSKSSRVGHSRQTSLAEQSTKRASVMKRRLSSVGSVLEENVLAYAGAQKPSTQQASRGRLRSASARATSQQVSPVVTNLENSSKTSISSPAMEKLRMQDRARKLIGFRATSDAITPAEKSDAIKFTPSTDTARSSDLVASPRTGDTTPSATPSLDIDTPESTDLTSTLAKTSSRPRAKSKQRTSAYTHGLLKIPPSEARKNCDYHGWMKKKASGLMTTWKPRLFILRGRRLSYYYSESDTEERGVIDISSHKVLVANDDPMTTIHASVTGAAKASSTPRPDGLDSMLPVRANPPSAVFYFKLVPPKSGMSRAVQFTKPSVHYFQVDSIVEGRKWMGEIMKATIEHDLSNMESTNKQKTISLASARARRERPPALDDTKKVDEAKLKLDNEKRFRESGLGINIEEETKRTSASETQKRLGAHELDSTTSLDKMNDAQLEKTISIVSREENQENAHAGAAELPAPFAHPMEMSAEPRNSKTIG